MFLVKYCTIIIKFSINILIFAYRGMEYIILIIVFMRLKREKKNRKLIRIKRTYEKFTLLKFI